MNKKWPLLQRAKDTQTDRQRDRHTDRTVIQSHLIITSRWWSCSRLWPPFHRQSELICICDGFKPIVTITWLDDIYIVLIFYLYFFLNILLTQLVHYSSHIFTKWARGMLLFIIIIIIIMYLGRALFVTKNNKWDNKRLNEFKFYTWQNAKMESGMRAHSNC